MIQEELAKAALGYFAGKGMGVLFDEPGASIQDVKGWIQQAVADIKAYVSEELHRQLVEQHEQMLIVRVNATINDLRNYDLTRPRERQLLDAQTTRIGELIEDTRQMTFAGVLIYVNLVSLQLLIYIAYIKHHSRNGYLPLVAPLVSKGSAHVDACIAESLAWMQAGVDSVVIDPIFEPIGNADWQGCVRWRGGSECLANDGYQTIEGWQATKKAQRISLFEAERQRVIAEIHGPLRETVRVWKEVQAKATDKPVPDVASALGDEDSASST